MDVNAEDRVKMWFTDFASSKVESMSITLSIIFLEISLIEAIGKEYPPIKEEDQPYPYRVVESITNRIQLELTTGAKLFLSGLAKSPGEAVMYLSYLKYKQQENKRIFGMKELSWLFPEGFLTTEELSRLWDKQKYDGKNMLDLLEWK